MTSHRLLLLTCAALAAALAAPAAAPAKPVKWVTYSATVEAVGDYAAATTGPSAISRTARRRWTTTFPSIVFEGDRPHMTGAANHPTATSGFLVSARSSRDLGSEIAVCESTELSFVSPGRFLEAPYTPNRDPVIELRLLNGAAPSFDGCPKQAATWFDLQGIVYEGLLTYDTEFTFPREAFGMNKVVQLVSERATGRRCPGNPHGGMDTCTLDIEATVTFEKTGEWIADDGTPADPPPAPPPPVITEDDIPLPPAPGDDPDDLIIPMPGASAKLAPSAKTATVPVACATACRGTVTATPGARKRRRAARSAARAPARACFTAAPGRPARVTLRFARSARRAIRRARGVKVTITASSPGRPARRTLTLLLAR